MQPTTATLIVAALGIVGTFGAPIVTLKMNRAWQREQWMRDERVKEYRELLDALAESMRVVLMRHGDVLPSEDQSRHVEALSNITRVMRNRILIAAEAYQMDIETKWFEAIRVYRHTLDLSALSSAYGKIQVEIARAVQRHL